jgi:hypothetical protein
MCDCPLTVTISNKVSERSLAIAGSQPQITTTHANLYTQLTRTKIDGEMWSAWSAQINRVPIKDFQQKLKKRFQDS